MMMPLRAALVENMERPHRIYRRLLERIDGVKLVEAFYYPEDLLERLDGGLQLDVIVMDVRMDEERHPSGNIYIDGIEAARRIRLRLPRMPIVLYSLWDTSEYYRRVEEARFGTHYAFVKRYSLDDWDRIGEIIRLVVRGYTYIDPEMRIEMDLLKERREHSPLELLENDEQRKVLALLADGLSNDEIARAIARSTRWVEEEVKAIYQALGLSNEGSSDSRRIRAARMFHEDRLLQWEKLPNGGIALLAQDRGGEWRPLDQIKHEELEATTDAKVLNNTTP